MPQPVDTGQINLQAIQSFLNTVDKLKQKRRDREITTSFAKIDRDNNLLADHILNSGFSDEEKSFRINQLKNSSRRKKLEVLTQTGAHEPQFQPGVMGFMSRMMGAVSPLETAGVTSTPLTDALYGKLAQGEFPTPEEQSRQRYYDIREQQLLQPKPFPQDWTEAQLKHYGLSKEEVADTNREKLITKNVQEYALPAGHAATSPDGEIIGVYNADKTITLNENGVSKLLMLADGDKEKARSIARKQGLRIPK